MKLFERKVLTTFTLVLAIFGATYNSCQGARLDPSAWVVSVVGAPSSVSPPGGLKILGTGEVNIGASNSPAQSPPGLMDTQCGLAFDNDNTTMVTLTNFAASTNIPGLLIDMQRPCAVDRVVINGASTGLKLWQSYNVPTNPPMGLIVVWVGPTLQTMTNVAQFVVPYDAGNPIDTAIDVRFSPVVGEFVRVELQTKVTWGTQYWPGFALASQPPVVDTGWNIAEMEVYGSTNTAMNVNAVVLEANAPLPLTLAASDLSYYIGELTGLPCPIVTPKQTNGFSGNLYWVNDLASLATTYKAMTNNIATGALPTNEVNVVLTNGNVVLFSSWPYRCVEWSVWEFLEHQGIRWVYPDVHGDSVPTGAGVNLSILPLKYNSTATDINASWYITDLLPWSTGWLQPVRQEYLYYLRNRWKNTWGPFIYGLGGTEIPLPPATGVALSTNYAQANFGYVENFNAIVPGSVLSANTNWWGWLNPTSPPPNYYQTAFSMSNTNLINWVANEVLAYDASIPLRNQFPLNNNHRNIAYNLLPMDATLFSSDSNSLAANAKYDQPYPNSEAYVQLYNGYSWAGSYYQLLSGVAKIATNRMIGGLAYADLEQAPTVVYPSNVTMTVCLYGAPNLPMSAPANAGTKLNFLTWHTNCATLANYDYALLFTDYYQTNDLLPVPMVSATLDRARFLASIGALSGECQGDDTSIQYNPWDFYAYPRVRWNTNYASSNLLSEFFNGYYKEAGAPMLAYYKAMENYQYSNNINLHYVAYEYWANPGSFPRSILYQMETNLSYAESLATNWYVKVRLNDVQTSFNWLTSTALGIKDLTTLTNFSNFQTIPANGTTATLNIGKFTNCIQAIANVAFYPAQFNGTSWGLNGTSRIFQTLNFTNAGNYRVDVVGGVNYYNGGYSNLRLWLGASTGITNFPSTTVNVNQTNSFVLNVPIPTAFDLVLEDDSFGQFFTISQVRVTATQ